MGYLIGKNNAMFIKATDRSRQLRPDPATATGKYLQVLLEGVLRNA